MQGHRIILPEGINIAEPLPLIVIGAGKQLVLKNVLIVHADSLPACLQLGPGARLVAESKDKVTMIKGSDPAMPEDLQVWCLSKISARLSYPHLFRGAQAAHKIPVPFCSNQTAVALGQFVSCKIPSQTLHHIQCNMNMFLPVYCMRL